MVARIHALASPALGSATEAELAQALRAGAPGAAREVFERHAERVQSILVRVLGLDAEVPDLVHEVFVQALAGARRLREDQPLGPWLAGIAVFTARKCIRRRTRRRWLQFLPSEEVPEVSAVHVPEEARAALRATYAVLEHLPEVERVAFALRHFAGMELTEVAASLGVSLATAKRKLSRAQARFTSLARAHPELEDWLEGGATWTSR
jgi:RNA polymerase sigma-70 factor, ECF subfamily